MGDTEGRYRGGYRREVRGVPGGGTEVYGGEVRGGTRGGTGGRCGGGGGVRGGTGGVWGGGTGGRYGGGGGALRADYVGRGGRKRGS